MLLAGLLGAAARSVGPARLAPRTLQDVAGSRLRIYRQKADCQVVPRLGGRRPQDRQPDARRRQPAGNPCSTARRLILLIKCGRPGNGMPPFDKFAYSDGRCYGLKQADLKIAQAADARPAGDLAGARDRAIADFMLAKIIGQGPMDRAKCIDYLGFGRRSLQVREVAVRRWVAYARSQPSLHVGRDQFSANTNR